MTRLNIVLLVALVVSGVYLVRVAHESRRLYAELDKAKNAERLLDSDHERLKSDRRLQATPLRVEQVARAKLGMRPAMPAVTEYVPRDGRAAPAAVARNER